MAWRIFSQEGLNTGISTSPQYNGIGVLGSTATNVDGLRQSFACCCNACNILYSDLIINLDATNNVAPGHECCDAVFCLFVLDFDKTNETGQDHWIFLKRANLNSFPYCQDPALNPKEFDTVTVSENIISLASRGKSVEQCCFIQFLWVAAPLSRVFCPKEYTEGVNVDFQNTNWGPFKGDVGAIEPRQNLRVHGDITVITVYNAITGEVLKDERFISNTKKTVDVCQCQEGFVKNSQGICVPA